MALTAVSININGVRSSDKRLGFLQWLRSLSDSVHLVFVQETHCSSESECASWFRNSGFSYVGSFFSSRSCGTLILCRPSLTL